MSYLLTIKLDISKSLEEKIFEIRTDFGTDNSISKITSYFPLNDMERKKIAAVIKDESFDKFYSIFSDLISEEEWNKNKDQIKTKFQDELFDIDDNAAKSI